MEISMHNSFSLTKPYFFSKASNVSTQNSSLLLSLSRQTQAQSSIICLINRKRRIGSRRSRRFILEVVYFVAKNLTILPEPLALAIMEFGGGNGGGNGGGPGFWKALGGGGGGFDGRRRKRKNKKLGLFVGIVIAFGLGMLLVLGKELEADVFLGVLAVSLLGVSINGWRRGVQDWILGFSFCSVLVCLGLRREYLQTWAKGLRSMENVIRRKRRRAI